MFDAYDFLEFTSIPKNVNTLQGGPWFRKQLTWTAAVSLLFLSDGSQANKIVCRGTVDDLKLTLVTLATMVAVEAASKKNIFFTFAPIWPPLAFAIWQVMNLC